MNVLEFQDVRKSYGVGFLHLRRRAALNGLSFQVKPGECYGLIGPNGAGKTTAFSLVFGFSFPDAGEVRVLGSTPEATDWKRRVAYVPEQPYLHEFLTVREGIELAADLHGLGGAARRDAVRRWLDRVEMTAHADRRIAGISKGMKQRVALAMALLTDPEFIVLDEPTSGLDPLGRALVRDLMREIREAGRTVLFSTHILSDAEDLCDRVGFIAAGRLIAEGRLDDLLDADANEFEVVYGEAGGGSLSRSLVGREALPRALADLAARGCRIVSAEPKRSSLDELFARRFGKGVRPEAA